jgi:hypothetical protein
LGLVAAVAAVLTSVVSLRSANADDCTIFDDGTYEGIWYCPGAGEPCLDCSTLGENDGGGVGPNFRQHPAARDMHGWIDDIKLGRLPNYFLIPQVATGVGLAIDGGINLGLEVLNGPQHINALTVKE